jgi:cobalt/nickel transport system ATP-binding protein
MTVIEFYDVEYTYPDGTKALKGVNLVVKPGEIIGLIGPNGAGKSTLLMMIDALIFPEKGRAEVLGLQVKESNAKRIREHVELVFQNPDDMLFNPTVIAEVAFGLINRGVPENVALEHARRELVSIGFENLENKLPHRLSLGQKRLVSLISVLIVEPKILLLDEPTSNLDDYSKKLLENKLREYINRRKNNITMIIAGHDVEFIKKWADRLVMINDGKIVT